MMKEVGLLGSFCYGSGDREAEFTTAARAHRSVARGAGRPRHPELPLEDVATAFGLADDKKSGAIKVTLTP